MLGPRHMDQSETQRSFWGKAHEPGHCKEALISIVLLISANSWHFPHIGWLRQKLSKTQKMQYKATEFKMQGSHQAVAWKIYLPVGGKTS